ncbi:MAG: hypothetical protein GY705_02190 [Bacteroidetes bacterium]|nr:hypothetical protein [Bacteroidota bacterium]
MKSFVHAVIILGLSSTVSANSKLDNWFQTGGENYDAKIDEEHSATGSNSALLYSLSEDRSGKGQLLQTLWPCPITNGNLEVSVFIKTENVIGAGIAVDVSSTNGVTRYRHQEDEIAGSTTWTNFSKKVLIPFDCRSVNVGVYLKGTGKVWVDDFKLEEIGVEEILSKVSKDDIFTGPDKLKSPGFEK